MPMEFDPAKRKTTLDTRGLDMARADEVFAGATLTVEDDRKDYGEVRESRRSPWPTAPHQAESVDHYPPFPGRDRSFQGPWARLADPDQRGVARVDPTFDT